MPVSISSRDTGEAPVAEDAGASEADDPTKGCQVIALFTSTLRHGPRFLSSRLIAPEKTDSVRSQIVRPVPGAALTSRSTMAQWVNTQRRLSRADGTCLDE